MPVVPASSATFSFPVRVYYEDTDTAGVVYYANYLKFFERARTEWLRTLGFGQMDMARTDGKLFVVRAASTRYLKPARLDDALTINSQITRVGRASLEFSQWCERGGEMLATGQIEIGCVAADSLRPSAMPRAISARLTELVTSHTGSTFAAG